MMKVSEKRKHRYVILSNRNRGRLDVMEKKGNFLNTDKFSFRMLLHHCQVASAL